MSFNSTIRKFDEFTRDFEVEFEGANIWPYLRFYSLDKLHFDSDRKSKVSAGRGASLIGQMFYGWTNWLGKYDSLIFNVTGDRKMYEGRWTGKSDFIAPFFGKPLMLELTRDRYKPLGAIHSDKVVSRLPVLASEKLVERRVQVPEVVLKLEEQLQKEFQFEPALSRVYKQFVTRYRGTQKLIKRYNPRIAEVNAAYVDMPRVMALKKAGIPVIEMQHGIVNADHHGYQIYNEFDRLLFPDYLLSFGSGEKELMKDSTYISEDRVFPVGSFYLEYVNNQQIQSAEWSAIRSKSEVVIAVTGQDAYDDKLIPFLVEVLKRKPNWACIYIPRTLSADHYKKNFDLPANLHFVEELNTYQLMRLADIHTTVNSTCALESLALGTPNVLYDYRSKASDYFPQLQADRDLSAFASDVDSYIEAVEKECQLDSQSIIQRSMHLFAPEFSRNLKSFFEQFDPIADK